MADEVLLHLLPARQAGLPLRGRAVGDGPEPEELGARDGDDGVVRGADGHLGNPPRVVHSPYFGGLFLGCIEADVCNSTTYSCCGIPF